MKGRRDAAPHPTRVGDLPGRECHRICASSSSSSFSSCFSCVYVYVYACAWSVCAQEDLGRIRCRMRSCIAGIGLRRYLLAAVCCERRSACDTWMKTIGLPSRLGYLLPF